MSERLHRSQDVVEQQFEDDRVLLNLQTQQVVSLNPLASVLWDMFARAATVEEAVDLIQEARPEEDAEMLGNSVRESIATLHGRGFLVTAD